MPVSTECAAALLSFRYPSPIGSRVRIKSSGMAPGLANARTPGQHKICKCPAVARGGGGGLGAAGID